MLNQITTNAIAGSLFCAGTTIIVNFNTIGVANSGNIFTAQLSDASGSFTSPINIGSLTSADTGSITVEIPPNTSSGTVYRIRVVSSNPVITGSDNGNNITINALPIVTANATATTVCAGTSVTLTGSGATSYVWTGGVTNGTIVPTRLRLL